jgi:hypothetical protein
MPDSSHEPSKASALQITANRRNALKSTGPQTRSGKASSRMNALKHGLTAEQVVLFDEDVEEFERFFRKWVRAFKPKGFIEHQMVERIAICAWRLRRVYRIEAQLFGRYRTEWINGVASVSNEIDVAFFRLTATDNTLAKLTRYERHIDRSLRFTFRALEHCQRKKVPG